MEEIWRPQSRGDTDAPTPADNSYPLFSERQADHETTAVPVPVSVDDFQRGSLLAETQNGSPATNASPVPDCGYQQLPTTTRGQDTLGAHDVPRPVFTTSDSAYTDEHHTYADLSPAHGHHHYPPPDEVRDCFGMVVDPFPAHGHGEDMPFHREQRESDMNIHPAPAYG